MSMPELVAFFERYAALSAAPIELATTVLAVDRAGTHFRVETSRGTWLARHVVVATGYSDLPFVPPVARHLLAANRPDRADRVSGTPSSCRPAAFSSSAPRRQGSSSPTKSMPRDVPSRSPSADISGCRVRTEVATFCGGSTRWASSTKLLSTCSTSTLHGLNRRCSSSDVRTCARWTWQCFSGTA